MLALTDMENIKPYLLLLYFLLIIIPGCGSDSNGEEIPASTITFTSKAKSESDHNRPFLYQFSARDENGLTLDFEVSAPSWLSYDEATHTISGTPGWSRLNTSFNISITASNGEETLTQTAKVRVNLGEIICNSEFGDPADSPYILPFESGKSFELSQTYCPPNPNWGHHDWFAYDFDMPIGTPLLAARAGKVIAVRENQKDGTRVCGEENYIFILHDDGTVANYVHLKEGGVEVSVDEQVAQGQLIGYSGDSGCSIGPHLHIAIFRQQGPYNRQYTLPINFSNAEGPLNSANGLVQDGIYTAR